MRVLLLSKAAVRAVYHRQYEHIASQPEVEQLTVVVPPYWNEPHVGRLILEQVHPRNYTLKVTPLRWNGRYHLYYAPRLPCLIREFRPDLVHLDEEVYNFATFHAALAARRIASDTVAFCWQNIYRRYPPPFCWFEKILARILSGVIAGNADAAHVLHRKGFRIPIAIIPQYGVDTETFTPANPAAKPPFRVGYLGRLVPAKGIDVLLESLRQCPDSCEAWIGGEGNISLWKAQAERLGIAHRIHWVGAVPSTQVPAFLQTLHCLVLPSRTTPRWKEQFGRVLVEAMACGLPVIGSNSGEIPRVIGEGGFVFREGDAQQLAQHIRTLSEQTEMWKALSCAARERAVRHFSMEKVAAGYVAFWESVCSTPRKPLTSAADSG
jgi:glycosyltransferase involved in cell wall biosynthesis